MNYYMCVYVLGPWIIWIFFSFEVVLGTYDLVDQLPCKFQNLNSINSYNLEIKINIFLFKGEKCIVIP